LDAYGHAVAQNRGAVIGTLLSGRFRLEERVGSGGMSTVYRAYDETLERWVAIKILQSEIAEDDDQLERFRREARAVARLNHAHVVTVIDAGEDQGCPYIVFEYISGETLKERIRRLGRLPVPEALAYAIEIARALQAAHSEMLVHRDVKPQNVLLDTDGRAKVTDFGIARSLEGGGDGLTLAGRVLGTTDYVSPEQALGQEVTPQSDIYSLGIVLYEMLTGDVPFRADAPVAVAMKHVREPLPDVQLARPEVSANTAAIVEHATAKEMRNRYRTIEEMLIDLEGALALEATRAGQTSGEATTVLRALPESRFRVPWRVRFPRRVAALTALLLAIAAVIVVVVASRTHETKSPSAAPPQPTGTPALVAVKLPPTAANDYDPFGGDGEHHADVSKAIDHNPVTAWTTETYDSGIPTTKPGVGLYVNTTNPLAARRLDIISRQSPYSAQVLAASGEFAPPKIESWTPVSPTVNVNGVSHIPIDTKGKSYRFYLLWITKLPAGGKGGVNELTLNR
jgi:eukaryotic-like serine/threonine-protein kinase